ncbi:hypothetical protein GJ629_05730 [Halapricum sp. CBA1109]|uniref:hypothetical protein n=1 Tax=Halapricum sp. CBA1109 TaxID=2668068 RepID=UPI0012F71C04|nr:hypothetical protein [Halapricum sp. CBA1109]MUV89458.1 hypothetical protein [Halapricum sp. CBA1109]
MPEGTAHTISVESGADDAETVSPTGPPAERIRSDVQRVREAVDGATPGLEQAFEAQFVWGRLPRQKYRSLTQREEMGTSEDIERALSGLERDLDAAVAESGALQWIDDNEGQFVTIAAEAITTAIQLKLAGFGESLQGTIEDQLSEFVEDVLSAETIRESRPVELTDGTEATRTRLSLQGEFDLLQTVQVGMPCLLTTTVERGTVPPETTVEDVNFEPSEASVEIV